MVFLETNFVPITKFDLIDPRVVGTKTLGIVVDFGNERTYQIRHFFECTNEVVFCRKFRYK
jgi:hypothetical protein